MCRCMMGLLGSQRAKHEMQTHWGQKWLSFRVLLGWSSDPALAHHECRGDKWKWLVHVGGGCWCEAPWQWSCRPPKSWFCKRWRWIASSRAWLETTTTRTHKSWQWLSEDSKIGLSWRILHTQRILVAHQLRHARTHGSQEVFCRGCLAQVLRRVLVMVLEGVLKGGL